MVYTYITYAIFIFSTFIKIITGGTLARKPSDTVDAGSSVDAGTRLAFVYFVLAQGTCEKIKFEKNMSF